MKHQLRLIVRVGPRGVVSGSTKELIRVAEAVLAQPGETFELDEIGYEAAGEPEDFGFGEPNDEARSVVGFALSHRASALLFTALGRAPTHLAPLVDLAQKVGLYVLFPELHFDGERCSFRLVRVQLNASKLVPEPITPPA